MRKEVCSSKPCREEPPQPVLFYIDTHIPPTSHYQLSSHTVFSDDSCCRTVSRQRGKAPAVSQGSIAAENHVIIDYDESRDGLGFFPKESGA